MDKMKQLGISIAALIVLVALAYLFCTYIATPEPPKEHCLYEIKYLHMSGRKITKRVYMTCQGFYTWYYGRERYKVPTMVLRFSDGNEVIIQGATDVLSIAKITTLQKRPENE